MRNKRTILAIVLAGILSLPAFLYAGAPPPFPFLPAANKLLPGVCTNGYTTTYSTTTGLWGCAALSGGGDVTAGTAAHTWGDGTGPQVWTFSVTGTDATMTVTAGAFTLNTSLALGANDLTMTGSLGATGARLTKIWSAAAEFTAYPTVNGAAVFDQDVSADANPSFGTLNLVSANSLNLGTAGSAVGGIRFKNATSGYVELVPITGALGTSQMVLGTTFTDAKWCSYASASGFTCNQNAPQSALTYPVTGVASPTAGYLTKWGVSGNAIVDGPKLGTLTDAKGCSFTTAGGLACTDTQVAYTEPAGTNEFLVRTGAATTGGSGILKGTMTNDKFCKYITAGTKLECNYDAAAGVPTTITVAGEASDTTSFPLFVTAATGDLGPKTNAGLTFDASTATLGATKFAGALNGTVGASTPAAGAFTTITASTSLAVTAAATTGGYIRLLEGTDNGTDYSSITGAADAGTYPSFTFSGSKGSEDLTLTATNDKWTFASTTGATITITPALTVTGALTLSSQLNLMTSDADPATTAGGIKHDSSSTESQTTARGVLKWFDGTSVRTLADIGTDSTIIVKTEFLPIRWAEDGTTAPSAAAEVGTTTIVGRSFTEADDVVFWWVVPLDYVGGIKYRVIYALSANAQANETVIFSMAGSDMVHSGALAGSAGTALTITQELTTDEDTGEVMITDYSAESNADWNLSAGALARLNFSNAAAGDYTGEPLVIGIEIKYKAKLVGLAGY